MSLLNTNFMALCGCALLTSVATLSTLLPAVAQSKRSGKLFVYVGGYTTGKTKGIFIYSMNRSTGQLTPEGVGPDVESPSFLALHPNHQYLYAVNETDTFNGKPGGGVSSYKIDPETGALTLINEQTSGGTGPCHIVVDAAGKNVLVANYGGGSVEVLPIHPDGSLGEPTCFVQHTGKGVDPARQEGPHAHSTTVDPTGKFALVCDLGTDKIVVYKYDSAAGTIDATGVEPGVVAPGSGPRHFVFTQDNKHAFVINEMKSTITGFNYDGSNGSLKEFQTISTLPADYTGSTTCAEIAISSDGKFLYGSNRGHDSIAIYSIAKGDYKLTLIGIQPTGGKTPRNFAMDPSGKFLVAANQNSNNLVVFKRDKGSGKLTQTGQPLEAPAPVTIVFLPQDTK